MIPGKAKLPKFYPFGKNFWALWWKWTIFHSWFLKSVVLPIFLCPFVIVIHNSTVAIVINISFLSKNLYALPNFSLILDPHGLISACLPAVNDFTHAEDCGNTT